MTSTSDTGTGTGSTPPPAGHVLVRFTAAVHAAADRVAEAPGWSMTEAEAAAAVVGLTRLEARVAELRLRALAAADGLDVAKGGASSSTGAWLAGATRQRRAGAAADVRFAAALDGEFEATRAALAGGEVLVEQARVVVAAVQALPAGLDAATRRRAEAQCWSWPGSSTPSTLPGWVGICSRCWTRPRPSAGWGRSWSGRSGSRPARRS